MPDRHTFISIVPTISLSSTVPSRATSRFTFSITSRNTSFFLYLMPSWRQLTTFVRFFGTTVVFSRRWLSCVMYSFITCVSVIYKSGNARICT